MDYYFELRALPNPEILQSEVIAHLMGELHLALTQYNGEIGLDFPGYAQGRGLGGIIRLLGRQSDIIQLHHHLTRIPSTADYALITNPDPIPKKVQYHHRYQRQHAKGNSRLRRLKKRQIAAGTWSEEKEAQITHKFAQPLTLPHIRLKSRSTNQPFILFIKRDTFPKPKEGEFNSYGLSLGEATVPKF